MTMVKVRCRFGQQGNTLEEVFKHLDAGQVFIVFLLKYCWYHTWVTDLSYLGRNVYSFCLGGDDRCLEEGGCLAKRD